MLADLSAQFVNVPPDEVDHAIEDAQRRVCECLGLDLSALWQWAGEGANYMRMTHLHRPPEFPPVPDLMDAREFFPWCQEELKAGRVVVVMSMEDLPPEAARDKSSWLHFGIKTNLTFPLSAGRGPTIGALSFNTLRKEHPWPEPIVKRLQLVSLVFANALARKRSEQLLRVSEERLRLAADSAGAGMWVLDVDAGRFWITEKARELFQFGPDIDITMGVFLQSVHAEDRERVRQAVEDSVRERREVRVEYRIVRPDGSIRWISSVGRPQLDPAGKPDRLMGISSDVTERKDAQMALEQAYREIAELKERLHQENVYLRQEVAVDHAHGEIIGQSEAIRRVIRQAEQVAPTSSSVLIQGETGCGKELIAHLIHQLSPRRSRLMVTVNCGALPSTLIESELFGREKGAFTGALTRQAGRFEVADGSTIFLDEIGDLSPDLQVKLLRVLQEGHFERLGSSKTITVDVRVIAATNRDLAEDVRTGAFRQDLYYRLNVFPIKVPPLRERPGDIPLMVQAFTNEFAWKFGRKIQHVSRRVMEAMERYSWPGNIRELRNVIERAIIVSPGDTLLVDLPLAVPGDDARTVSTLAEAEADHIRAVLKQTGGRIKGPGGAASILGMKPSTLYTRMKKLGILPRNQEEEG